MTFGPVIEIRGLEAKHMLSFPGVCTWQCVYRFKGIYAHIHIPNLVFLLSPLLLYHFILILLEIKFVILFI